MKLIITTLAALAVSLTFATAADEAKKEAPKKGGNPEEMFKKLDTNADGKISKEEFKAGPMGKRNPEKADEAFAKRDKNSDGSIDLEEFKAGRQERGEKKTGT